MIWNHQSTMKYLKTSGQDKLKLPYKLRSNQQKIIDTIKKGLDSKNHVVIEAPTGSGKTFTSLASALPLVLENNQRWNKEKTCGNLSAKNWIKIMSQ